MNRGTRAPFLTRPVLKETKNENCNARTCKLRYSVILMEMDRLSKTVTSGLYRQGNMTQQS